jgi:hypothetical protein
MAYYRYYSILPRAGTSVVELPLYGVQCDKVFSGAGNFTGTMRLGTGKYNDLNILNGAVPGKHGLVVKRNDVAIWAGMIWSRSYASEASTMQFTGQTFESIFAHIANRADYTWTASGAGAEDTVLWTNMLNNMQTQESGDFDFDFTLSHPGALSGKVRYVDYLAAEYRYYSEIVEQLSGYDDGYGYTINCASSGGTDAISKTFELVLNSNSAPHSGLYLDFPGQVSKYWYTENGARGGVRHTGLASSLGPGATMPSATINNTDRITDGFVPWHNVETFTDPVDDQDLINKTTQMARDQKIPIAWPVFELGQNNTFDHWDKLGRRVTVYIQDPKRFPDWASTQSLEFTRRMMGWSLTPESADGQEIIRLQIEGEQ